MGTNSANRSESICTKIQTHNNRRIIVAQRSGLISLALLLIPNIILFSFRNLSPDLGEALSNDDSAQILAHLIALIIGVIIAYRYSVVHDHEFRRTKAISALSKTYKLEDRGLWDKGEVAIQKLEARAHSDFKGRKAITSRRRMHGKIGDINRESTVSVDGIDQKKETIEELPEDKPNLISRVSKLISSSVEKTASRREERRKKALLKKSESSYPLVDDENSRWAIPQGTQMKTILCDSCSTYNDAESNYCSACGSLIA